MSNTVFGTGAIGQVKIDDTYVSFGCQVSFSFEYRNELIFKTDVNAGLNRKRRARMGDSSMSVSGLTTLTDDTTQSAFYFLQEAVRRSELDLRFFFTDEVGVQKQIQGIYIIESLKVSSKTDDWSEFDIDFQGTGDISLADPDDSGTEIPGNIQWDWWVLAEGATSVTGAGHFGRSFAGEEVIEADREGVQHDAVTSSPSGRQYAFDGTSVSFDATLPGNPGGERVYVLWKEV